ncbi:MAG: type II secretion system protein N [Pseudomonadota bacterium]
MTAPLAVATLVFVVTLIVNAPASLLPVFVDLDEAQISYSGVSGTVWNGNVSDASIAGAPLGAVSFEVSPWSLLGFSPQIALSMQGGAIAGEGRVTVGPGRKLSLKDSSADIEVAAIAPRGVFGEPAFGLAKLEIRDLSVNNNVGCISADGSIWTDVLDAPAKRFNLPALPMAGAITCDRGELLVTLFGENARARADITLRIDRTLAYEITATARPAEESVASALRVFGFEDENGALTYGSVGVFRGTGS